MNKKQVSSILVGFFMSLGMAFTMSFVMTLVNVGLVPYFIFIWMRAFLIGFLVSFPTALIVLPYARKIVGKIISI